MKSARERALAEHWDVDCVPPEKRNPAGIAIAVEIRRMNVAARIDAEKRRKGLAKLARAVRD